tara:strand:- start:478 stop:765 length:288 start_codon:yes stop_codon:yes gene_type:complete
MKIELVIIILIFVLLNSQHNKNTTKKENFDNEKYYNLQKRIEPTNKRELANSHLFAHREFIKPDKNELWNPYYETMKDGHTVIEYDRIFLVSNKK